MIELKKKKRRNMGVLRVPREEVESKAPDLNHIFYFLQGKHPFDLMIGGVTQSRL